MVLLFVLKEGAECAFRRCCPSPTTNPLLSSHSTLHQHTITAASSPQHTHPSAHTRTQHNTNSFFAELEANTGALVLKHANAPDDTTAYWASHKPASGGKKRGSVRVKVLKDRAAFGVFDGETPVWVSDQ